MTLEQLVNALDRYGGDMTQWPADLRRRAETLADQNPLAAQRIAEARRLDEMLGKALAAAPVDAALMGRIVAHVHGNGSGVMLRPTRRLIGWASAAIAASLIAGFVVGVALPPSQGEDVMAELMFGDSASSSTSGDLL